MYAIDWDIAFDDKCFSVIFATLIKSGVLLHPARVAKLVDALCSGRSVGNHVLVRIQSRAPKKPLIIN